MSARLLRIFDELPPEERARIAAAHILYSFESGDAPTEPARRAVRISPDAFPELEAVWDFERGRYQKNDALDALLQVWHFIARFQLKEAEDCLNSMERTVGIFQSLYLSLQGLLLVLRGDAETAVRMLEKEMERSAAAGRASEAEAISFGNLLLKMFLDADWLAGTEAYCVYAQRRLEKNANFNLLYDFIFLRTGEYQRLAVSREPESEDGAINAFHQFFRAAGLWRLRRAEQAEAAFTKAVSMARNGGFWFPMLFFHEILACPKRGEQKIRHDGSKCGILRL